VGVETPSRKCPSLENGKDVPGEILKPKL